MPITEQETWAVARLYVDRFGANAKPKADLHARDLRVDGDSANLEAWLRVMDAIGAIQAQGLHKGGPLN